MHHRNRLAVHVTLIAVVSVILASCAPAQAPAAAPAPAQPQSASNPPAAAPTAAPRAPALAATATLPTPAPVVRETPAVPASSAGSPKRGGMFTHASYTRSPDADPHTNNAALDVALDLCYDTLMTVDPVSRDIVPGLAESWDVSKDGLTFTFHLRKGVKFQDIAPVSGREFTADDVVYSFDRIRTPSPQFLRGSLFAKVISIKALDKYTVEMKLSEQFGPLLTYVVNYSNKMVAKEAVAKFGNLGSRANCVGTGPFTMKTWREPFSGEMVRNATYWDATHTYLDSVRIQVIEDTITRMAALRTGQVDVAVRIPPSSYAAIKDQPTLTFDPEAVNWVSQILFNINRKPWSDERVRKAAYLAIDRDAVVKGAHEGAAFISGPLPPAVFKPWALQPDELRKLPGYRQPKDQDVAEAKRLLTEAGYPNGFDAEAPVSEYSPISSRLGLEVAQGDLRKIGIRVSFKQVEPAAFLQADLTGNFDLINRGYGTGVEPEPDAMFSQLMATGGSRNYLKLVDPKLNSMVAEGVRTLDTTKRIQLYKDLQYYVLDKAYRAFLDEPFTYTGKQKFVRGYNGQWILDNRQIAYVWLDK
ncbi:MAG: ABC transporter substrate-binding protein [Dehalococcoidia bacterium]|nr:ABC transporter substrate-binding protein [Dehalococcoidia bacterium]